MPPLEDIKIWKTC